MFTKISNIYGLHLCLFVLTVASYELCLQKGDLQTDGEMKSCATHGEKLAEASLVNGTVPRDDLLPKWIDLGLVRDGQKWAMKNYEMLTFSHLGGLIGSLAFPGAYEILHFTNQTSTPEKASERYANTISQVSSWYYQEINDNPDNNEWLNSLVKVRRVHTEAMISGNKRLLTEKRDLINPELFKDQKIDEEMWAAFEKDLNESNIPQKFREFDNSYGTESIYAISQFQLAMTLFAYVGFPVYCPEGLYLFGASDEELFAFNHLWAVLGYALGIEDKYNIALQPDLKSAKEMYKYILEHYYLPTFFNCNFYCKLSIESMLKGLQIISPLLRPRMVLTTVMVKILQIPVQYMYGTFDGYDFVGSSGLYTIGIPYYLANIKKSLDFEKKFTALSKHFREAIEQKKHLVGFN